MKPSNIDNELDQSVNNESTLTVKSESFLVIESEYDVKPLGRQTFIKSSKIENKLIGLKWQNHEILDIPFEAICNKESLRHLAENGKQPGVELLMQNYLVSKELLFDR